jgi:gliding motility-associated-like protein
VINPVTTSLTRDTVCSNQLPYVWNNNSYNSAGTYSVTLTNSRGCDSIATLALVVKLTSSSITRDTICANFLPYLWNGNSYPAAGTYTVTLVNSVGCDSLATLQLVVRPVPVLVINQPAPVCAPETINLTSPAITAGSEPGITLTYWLDSLATIPLPNPQAVFQSGTYYIRALGANGCFSTKPVAVNVLVHSLIPGIRYPTLTTPANTNLNLDARNFGVSYLWAPPVGLSSVTAPSTIFNHDRETEYTVAITGSNGCTTVDTVLVKIILIVPPPADIRSDIFVPKAWTPNKDGHNDNLKPLTVNIKELKFFRVFNRWGQLMFETNIIGNGWDGIFKGQPQVMDVYTWTLEALGEDGKTYRKAGNAVLIR